MPRLSALADHLRTGGEVVWPEDGIGTALAELPTRAPRIWHCLERARLRLEALSAAHPAPPLPPPPPVPAAQHPFVRKVLAAFPGAEIVSVIDRTVTDTTASGETQHDPS